MNTNVFHHTLHRLLWQWLADNPSKSKKDWVGWKSNGGDVEDNVESMCFVCDYTRGSACEACPLDFGKVKIDISFECLGGLHYKWTMSDNPTERTELALKIKDLPVKDGVVCD